AAFENSRSTRSYVRSSSHCCTSILLPRTRLSIRGRRTTPNYRFSLIIRRKDGKRLGMVEKEDEVVSNNSEAYEIDRGKENDEGFKG
ncbi:unnamed protein product, partial [Dovyalis caffra]